MLSARSLKIFLYKFY